MARTYLFTSESVTEGHPDKICDQISDAVLDAILAKDPNGRVACETTASTGLVHIMGEITTSCYVDIPKIAREVIRDIGYDRAKYGFDCDTCGVMSLIHEQSPDIAQGVDESFETQTGATTDPIDLIGLLADGHILMDDAEAAFPGHGDGHAAFGDGIHGGADERGIEVDIPGQAGADIDIGGQHIAVGRHHQDVIEGECLRQKFGIVIGIQHQ